MMSDIGGKTTLLLVEDEIGVRDPLVEGLDGFGYTVLVAEDGSAALRILKSAVKINLLDRCWFARWVEWPRSRSHGARDYDRPYRFCSPPAIRRSH